MSNIIEIKSHIPGTFYSKESPTSSDYVSVGNTVNSGDVVGLVEVMKMFNQIKSEVSGVVVEILVENEDLVDVDQVLMRIEV